MMTAPVSVERRIGQRFAFNLPVCLREISSAAEGLGFTQDVSSRGAFLFTDMAIKTGTEIELTMQMPSEITLGESMRVRCRGRVLRVMDPLESLSNHTPDNDVISPLETQFSVSKSSLGESSLSKSLETKIGIAVCFRDYEYLSECEDLFPAFRRIAALHGPVEGELAITPETTHPRNVADPGEP
jgi:hypothetical protein